MRNTIVPDVLFVAGIGTGLGAGRFLPPSSHQEREIRRSVEAAQGESLRMLREARLAAWRGERTSDAAAELIRRARAVPPKP